MPEAAKVVAVAKLFAVLMVKASREFRIGSVGYQMDILMATRAFLWKRQRAKKLAKLCIHLTGCNINIDQLIDVDIFWLNGLKLDANRGMR